MTGNTDSIGESDFLAAAARGDADVVRGGLDGGVAADTADTYGNTALMMACARGQREVCRVLLDAGANPEHRNRYGFGPRQWAEWASDGTAIRALLD